MIVLSLAFAVYKQSKASREAHIIYPLFRKKPMSVGNHPGGEMIVVLRME